MPRERRKLEPSKLATQLQLLKTDLSATGFKLVTKGRTFKLDESVIGGDINRTIDGASTLSIIISDRAGYVRNSGMLGSEIDIKVDGLWFRLVKVGKSGNDLTLTFESREVAILRTYNNRRVAGWDKMSRTRFAEILMKESPQTRLIPFVCPELKKGKKIKTEDDRLVDREYGFGVRRAKAPMGVRRAEDGSTGNIPDQSLTVKREVATPTQQANIEQVLDVGLRTISIVNKHRRKIMVSAIMTGTQESSCNNLPFGHLDSVGFFQQRPSQGWGTKEQCMDLNHAATEYFTRAIEADSRDPSMEYAELCQAVQISAFPDAYRQWRNEAERWVSAYGMVGGDYDDDSSTAAANLMSDWESDATEFQFMRGHPSTDGSGRKKWVKEDTWACLQRLASEVQWRSFEVSGAIYFISEPQLFKSAPRARISETSEGVDWIDFDYDVGKKTSTLTIIGRADRWAAPPGTVVEIFNNGPVNGRWLVSEIRRPIFSSDVTITCKKPRAKLPEPTRDEIGGLWDNVWTGEPAATYTPEFQRTPSGKYPTGAALREAVLNNPMIEFKTPTQRQDVQFGNVDEQVLQFLIAFAEGGFPSVVSSLKTGHSTNVARSNRISAHSVGKAVDIGNYTIGNPNSRTAMQWIASFQVELGFSQLIGPVDELVIPIGYYDQDTLEGHDDHIHVGWPM